MSTLVIHPKDPSTDFLSVIYEDIIDKTVISKPVSSYRLAYLMGANDRIIMMGHGTPYGLLGWGGFAIHPGFVELLREKQNSVYIWCHANKFVEKNKLKGFATGMIISEIGEAFFYGITSPQSEITESNQRFAASVRKYINLPEPQLISEGVLKSYYHHNPIENQIIDFNSENIFHF